MIQGVTLRSYQNEAVEMMVARGRALLSLCMGAGKTVTSLAAVEELMDEGVVARGLVIVPASLKYQWQREIRRFTGRHALVIDGSPSARKNLYAFVPKTIYTIVNYETLRSAKDWKYWRDADFDFLIIDEISYCKSPTAQRTKKVRFMSKRCDVVFGLTGQPVENRAEELYSIMQVVDPMVLGDYRVFDRTFIVRDHWNKPVRYRNLKTLRKTMSDVMYRKTRDDIADQFPRLVSTVVPFDMSASEHKLYNVAAIHTLGRLAEAMERYGPSFSLAQHYGEADDNAESMKIRGDIMAGMLLLRLIADDPLLVIDSARLFEENVDDKGHSKVGSALAYDFVKAGLLDHVGEVSTKRQLFAELLADVYEEDPRNKVVAFSTFKGMIRRVQDDVADMTRSVQFTGDMNAWQKSQAMATFKDSDDCRLFLSSDAGGYGVDLPEGNHLFSLDLPWSTGAFEQREARIIRISSEWEHVNLISLQAAGSIDERIYEMINAKHGVSAAFIDGKFDSQGIHTPTLGSLTAFLSANLVS
jgi:SNF2 family DNA or RNA helicase